MWKMRYYARRYDAPATYVLIAAMVAGFLVDFFTNQQATIVFMWRPSMEWLKDGPYWQPFTFPFAHTGVLNLLFDGILLFWFGSSLERAWGTAKYLVFFFSSGIIAGLVLIAAPLPPVFAGMAGSFVAITVAFAAMNPYAPIMFWFIPMQARFLALLIVAFELFGNYGRYGSPLQALMSIAAAALYAYFFTTRRVSLPTIGSGHPRPPGGPSIKERFDRWQQRRRMRQWQRKVSKIERPEDLFKDK